MKIKVSLSSHLSQVVDGSVVIDVPDDATDEEIDDLAPALEDLVTNWEAEYGVPVSSDAALHETEVEMIQPAEEGEDDFFTFVRTPEGKLALKE